MVIDWSGYERGISLHHLGPTQQLNFGGKSIQKIRQKYPKQIIIIEVKYPTQRIMIEVKYPKQRIMIEVAKNICRRISSGRRLLNLADTFEPGLTAARFYFYLSFANLFKNF